MKIELTESEIDVIQICLASKIVDYRMLAEYYSERNETGINTDRIDRSLKMYEECSKLFNKIADMVR